MTAPRLYLLQDIAEMTGLSARGLADAARDFRIETYKIQGRRYMSEAQINAWLDNALTGPQTLVFE